MKKPYPGEASASGSESDDEDDEDHEDEDLDDASESSSQARPKQMKGDKVHPLRRWAMSKVDAIAKGFFKG